MQENTNKAIAVNSIITYAKIIINAILGLFTTRYALIALGVDDYGLFSVLGSLISFIMVINSIMVSTCNRFLSVAIGKGDSVEINNTFNINLIFFSICAIFLLIVALPIGLWYTNNYINYDGPIENARMVFIFTVFSSLMSIVALPYNGLLLAKERFFIFSFVEVVLHIIRFAIVLMLVFYFEQKLLIYTVSQSITTILPVLVYWLYCKKVFPEIVKWNPVRDKQKYKSFIEFSGWVSLGAFAAVGRLQGAALLVNVFFSTVMNTALGLANTVNSYVIMFTRSLTQPIQPQISKSFSAGDYSRTDELLVMSTKYSFLLTLLIGTPFFVNGEWIMSLWLGKVPPYATSFAILLIIDNLVLSFNSGLSPVIFADGRIALYQILVNTLRSLAVIAGYFTLRLTYEPHTLFLCYIFFSVITVFATQYCMHKTLNYDMSRVYRESYRPSLTVLLFLLPILFIPTIYHPCTNIFFSLIYLSIIEIFFGLNVRERKALMSLINNTFRHIF